MRTSSCIAHPLPARGTGCLRVHVQTACKPVQSINEVAACAGRLEAPGREMAEWLAGGCGGLNPAQRCALGQDLGTEGVQQAIADIDAAAARVESAFAAIRAFEDAHPTNFRVRAICLWQFAVMGIAALREHSQRLHDCRPPRSWKCYEAVQILTVAEAVKLLKLEACSWVCTELQDVCGDQSCNAEAEATPDVQMMPPLYLECRSECITTVCDLAERLSIRVCPHSTRKHISTCV